MVTQRPEKGVHTNVLSITFPQICSEELTDNIESFRERREKQSKNHVREMPCKRVVKTSTRSEFGYIRYTSVNWVL